MDKIIALSGRGNEAKTTILHVFAFLLNQHGFSWHKVNDNQRPRWKLYNGELLLEFKGKCRNEKPLKILLNTRGDAEGFIKTAYEEAKKLSVDIFITATRNENDNGKSFEWLKKNANNEGFYVAKEILVSKEKKIIEFEYSEGSRDAVTINDRVEEDHTDCEVKDGCGNSICVWKENVNIVEKLLNIVL